VHNSITGWADYSHQANFSEDRKSATVRFKDWGYGDADGIPDGNVVDPSGFGIASWISGKISDSSTGQPVNHAVITISSLVVTTSLVDGNYLSMIVPGTYSISVSAGGYKYLYVSGVQVPEGVIVTKNFTLEQRPKATPWVPFLLDN
jgi:hypothetical protein